jgi:hypothetical protein
MNLAVLALICGALLVAGGIKILKGWPALLRYVCIFLGFIVLSYASFQFDTKGVAGWGSATGAIFAVFAVLTVLVYGVYLHDKRRVEREDL